MHEPVWYMREDHSFHRLSGSIDEMLQQAKIDFDAGHTHGMLCSKAPGFTLVHAQGDWQAFEQEARAELQKGHHEHR